MGAAVRRFGSSSILSCLSISQESAPMSQLMSFGRESRTTPRGSPVPRRPYLAIGGRQFYDFAFFLRPVSMLTSIRVIHAHVCRRHTKKSSTSDSIFSMLHSLEDHDCVLNIISISISEIALRETVINTRITANHCCNYPDPKEKRFSKFNNPVN